MLKMKRTEINPQRLIGSAILWYLLTKGLTSFVCLHDDTRFVHFTTLDCLKRRTKR